MCVTLAENGKQISKEVQLANDKSVLVTMPCPLFDALCLCIGNAYKAECWIAARCGEVDTLSQQSIERYVNMMTCDKLGLARGSSRILRITVSPITAPEFSAKDRPC